MEILSRALRAYNSLPRLVKTGLPFISFVIGGSFLLKEFSQLRYDYRRTKQLDSKSADALEKAKKKPAPTLEEVYEEIKDIDVDNWTNIRGPRPEEPETMRALKEMKAQAKARRKEALEAKMRAIRES